MTDDTPLAAARRLAPRIREASDEIESTGRLPGWLVSAMVESHLFQLSLPASMGGHETPPLEAYPVLEALARADGSVGWCASIANSVSLLCGGWLPPAVGTEMFGTPPDARIAGSIRPEGRARITEGGYRVSGRWDFASGIRHATWLFCTCEIAASEGEPPSRTVSAMIPAGEATVIDTWSVAGLHGTGSNDFEVEDVFVPTAHTVSTAGPPVASGPLYHPRLAMIGAWAGTAATALGIARGALDDFAALAGARGTTMTKALLRERPHVQARYGEAEAIVAAARAYLLDSVGRAWTAVKDGEADPGDEIASARLAITHAMHEAVRAVDILFHAAGTNAVYRRNRVERRFRDAHCAAQHAAGLPAHVETAGRRLLGIAVREPGW